MVITLGFINCSIRNGGIVKATGWLIETLYEHATTGTCKGVGVVEYDGDGGGDGTTGPAPI